MYRRFHMLLLVLLLTCFSITLMGDEKVENYFPTTIGSLRVLTK